MIAVSRDTYSSSILQKGLSKKRQNSAWPNTFCSMNWENALGQQTLQNYRLSTFVGSEASCNPSKGTATRQSNIPNNADYKK